MLQSGIPFRVQALKRFRAGHDGLATFLTPIVAQSCFNVFNVHTEIKLILILIANSVKSCITNPVRAEILKGERVWVKAIDRACRTGSPTRQIWHPTRICGGWCLEQGSGTGAGTRIDCEKFEAGITTNWESMLHLGQAAGKRRPLQTHG